MVACCTIWGLSGLFFRVLEDVPVLEVLAHRTFWSAVVFLIVLRIQRRMQALRVALRPKSALIIACAALFITGNWFTYVWAIHNHHALEASLGYYIFPLFSVVLGVVFLGEKLGWPQRLAVLLAALAVLYLGIGLGRAPFVPLTLGVTFGMYGLIKKGIKADPLVSVTAEVLLLAPLSLGYMLALELGWAGTGGGHFGRDPTETLFLVLSAGLTAVPLMLFSYAAQRLKLSTVGLMQYMNPTLQLMVALFIFAEPLTPWHKVTLPVIWIALALYSYGSFGQARLARAAAAPK